MQKYTPEIIEDLTTTHITRYTCMINSKSTNVRVYECLALLDIWKSIKNKEYNWDKLSQEEKNEVLDAIYDEG